MNIDGDDPQQPKAGGGVVLQPKARTGKLLEDMCVKASNDVSPTEEAADDLVEMEVGGHAETVEDEVGGVTIGMLGHGVGEDFVNPPDWKDPDEYRSDPRTLRDYGYDAEAEEKEKKQVFSITMPKGEIAKAKTQKRNGQKRWKERKEQ